MAMTVEEYIQHHAVSGSLTIEDRQYIELQDVRKLIQMVLDEQKETKKEQRRRILDESLFITPEKLKLIGTEVASMLPKEESLQQRMCRYCDLAGYEYRQKGKDIEYDTPSGVTVTIYPWPIRRFGWSQHWFIYGHLDRHDRWGVKYLDEPKAKYLYDLLEKKIEELKQNKNNK